MVFSLIYASESLIPQDQTQAQVHAIVDVSQTRNDAMDVTGCLLFAAGRFAQMLEGSQADVETLMHSITRDTRHTDIRIVSQAPAGRRRFPGWALGYAGHSLFVQKIIARVTTENPHRPERPVADLLLLMRELRAAPHDAEVGV